MMWFDTYSGDESLGPLAVVHGVGGDEAHFALRHQLPLRCRGRLHQGAGGRRDGLGRLQDLLLEVQRLISLLRREKSCELDGLRPKHVTGLPFKRNKNDLFE